MFWVFVSWQPAASSVSVGALGCTNLNILNLNLVFSIWSCRYPQSSGNMWAARCGYVAKLMDPKKLVSAMETTPGTRRGYAWCVGRRAWTCAVAVRLVTRCDEPHASPLRTCAVMFFSNSCSDWSWLALRLFETTHTDPWASISAISSH